MDFFADNVPTFGLLLAVLTPLVTAVAQRPNWSKSQRSIVGAAISLVVGFLTVAAAGELTNITDLLTTLGIVVAASEAAYQRIWQPAGVAKAIESATSPAGEGGK